jgi:DNA-binding response OmpR family regulator
MRKNAALTGMTRRTRPRTDEPASAGLRQPRALLIEADPDYATTMQACLTAASCRVDAVPSVERGLGRLKHQSFDLVLWGVSSEETARSDSVGKLRAAGRCPLILVDESSEEARESFESGADQFLPKPFVPGALVGAVKSALRSQGPSSAIAIASRFEIKGTLFEADERAITTPDGKQAHLTSREWALLTFLLGQSNRYLRASDLIKQAWGESSLAPEQLRTYVSRLRAKTREMSLPYEIESRQGLGYRLVIEGGTISRS